MVGGMKKLKHCESGSQRQGGMELDCKGLKHPLTQTQKVTMTMTNLLIITINCTSFSLLSSRFLVRVL